ncbi:hypothetical protein GCM10010358_41960 [Streptomyces minutiscleroticus]|uniref:Uncharacterized protein n=1 Tax=Streptomyces minutiscleroticus TaxID=68238 RepID=A0A918NNK2_9ACTN|nr:hypothetical protein [Streptomyces minutiscleroticus]GGX83265.1 hypothetical protein GCM10010358_41960 [Streptomyces minutiscleroticus]
MTKRAKRQVSDGAAQAAIASVATGAGAALGGPAGALVGAAAAPALSTGLKLLSEKVARNRQDRSSEVLFLAAGALGLKEEELAGALLGDERLLELAGRVILSAQDISQEAKRRALALTLAAAVDDPSPARLDVMELVHSALSSIDAPHIRFMYVISDAEPLPELPEQPIHGQSYGMSVDQVSKRDPGLSEGASAILQKLLSLGLVESASNGITFGDRYKPYALSRLGFRLLSFLRDPQGE